MVSGTADSAVSQNLHLPPICAAVGSPVAGRAPVDVELSSKQVDPNPGGSITRVEWTFENGDLLPGANITRQVRAPLIDLFYSYGARTHVVYLHAPLHRLLQQDRPAEEQVPRSVLLSLFEKLEVSDLTEAHRVTVVESG